MIGSKAMMRALEKMRERERKLTTLAHQVARILNWPIEDVRSFSLRSLRELIREAHPAEQKLIRELDGAIRRGEHL